MLSYNSLLETTPCLEISGHELDMQMQSIRVGNGHIRLRSKLWQILVHLIENQNQLVSREDLIEYYWQGNNYTGEQGVTHTICHLRSILKKNNIDAKIMTIPKRGYVLKIMQSTFRNENYSNAIQLNY